MIELQLVKEFQFVAVDRLAQLGFKFGTLADFGLNLWVVKADGVATGSLGLILGQLRLPKQRLTLKLAVGKQCNADADAEEMIEVLD